MPPEHNNVSESTAAYKTPQLLFNNLKIERYIVLAKRYISERILVTGRKIVIQSARKVIN